jgi:TonB family protein
MQMKRFCIVLSLVISCGSVLFAQDSPLHLLEKPRANYTEAARQNVIIGVVILRVVFMSDGTIGTVEVAKALPFGLTEQAIVAAKRIRFEPKTNSGVPQSVVKTVEYRFDIYTDEDDKDLKRKVKIKSQLKVDLPPEKLKELRTRNTRIKVAFCADGVLILAEVNPEVDEITRGKIEEAVLKLIYVPAKLKSGHLISTTRYLKL